MIVSIQYLRAVAACLVVVFHYVNTFGVAFVPGLFSFEVGAFGVDVFFVISGYIMYMMSALRPRPPVAFLKDRILRIVPLYWALTLVAAFVSTDAGLSINLDVSLHDLLTSLFFIPAWNADYPTLVAPVLLVGWTLNLEMAFYVVFAFALFFPRRLGIGFVLLTLLAMGTARLWLNPDMGAAASLYSDTVVLEFGAGILIGALFEQARVTQWVSARRGVARGVAAALGVASIALLWGRADLLGPRGLSWGIPASMLVVAALLLEADLARTKIRFFELLGDASYSIYLVHLMAMPVVYSLIGHSMAQAAPVLALLGQISCAIAIGVVVYVLVEQPLTQITKGRRPFGRVSSTLAPGGRR